MATETKDSKENKEEKETKEIKQEKGISEWIAPILSALGSMGGSYMLWIKPLQERIDFLANHVKELQTELKELRYEQKQYEQELKEIRSLLERNHESLRDPDYIPTKRSSSHTSYLKKRI